MSTVTEPVIQFTENAANQVKTIVANDPSAAGKHLRIAVEKGGCSGLQYEMLFDQQRNDDIALDFHGVTVLVDTFSADYMRGSVVDYVDSLTGGGWKITNPKARQSCGCGNSFEA